MDQRYEIRWIFSRRVTLRWLEAGLVCGAIGLCCSAGAQTGGSGPILREPTFEQLAELTVVTVSKKEESAFRVPASVSVLTAKEIRRSGALTLGEALRWAPGLDVAQASNQAWAISARGFQAVAANKMLVLMDGRAVLLPLAGFANWFDADPVLETISQIEVVRGPGASVWGANAMNGVINVVTKSARDTQDKMVYAGGGLGHQGFAGAMVGVPVSDRTWLRVSARLDVNDASALPDGSSGDDASRYAQANFRLDGEPRAGVTYSVQGGAAYFDSDRKIYLPTFATASGRQMIESENVSGNAFLQGQWRRDDSPDASWIVRGFLENRKMDQVEYVYRLRTLDLEVQRNQGWGGRHEATWGAGYRWYHDKMTSDYGEELLPTPDDMQLVSFFAQNETRLADDRGQLLVGTKLEHHTYGGWQVQPTVHLSWSISRNQFVWCAVSRATRNPARSERGIILPVNITPAGVAGPLPVLTRTVGDPAVDAENMLAAELGYRAKLKAGWAFEVSGYANHYQKLTGVVPQTPVTVTGGAFPYVRVDTKYANALDGESYGVETSASWTLPDNLQVRAFYVYKRLFLHNRLPAAATPVFLQNGEGDVPEQTAGLRVLWNPATDWRADANVRAVSRLPDLKIAGYAELDLRLARTFGEKLTIELVGQNLLHKQHGEFRNALPSVPPHEVPRGVYLKVTKRY